MTRLNPRTGDPLRGLAVAAVLLFAACTTSSADVPSAGGIRYYHDAAHAVSCWTVYAASISCLPDSQVKQP